MIDYCDIADVDRDGAVTVADAIMVASCVATISRPWLAECDLTGDYWSDILDAEYVLRAIPLCGGWAIPEVTCGVYEATEPPYTPASQPEIPCGNGWSINFSRPKIPIDECLWGCKIEANLHAFWGWHPSATLRAGEVWTVDGAEVVLDAVELQGGVMWVEWCVTTWPPPT